MKTDRGGPALDPARMEPDGALSPPVRPSWRRAAAVFVTAVVLLTAAFAHHAVTGFVLTRVLDLVTGERVTIRAFRLGPTHSAFDGIAVRTAGGEPLFDARRLELTYRLRDVLPGGKRRFGLIAVSADGPVLTVVRHSDGSYNLTPRSASGGGSSGPAAAPLRLNVTVRDGLVRVIDRAPVAPDLAEQEIRIAIVRARIASDGRSAGAGRATLVSRPTAGSSPVPWPLTVSGVGDVQRGVATVRVRAAQLPLRGLVGFLQHSGAVRVDAGIAHGLDVRAFALNLGLGAAPEFHVGGGAVVAGGRLTVSSLQRPVRDIRGALVLTDDGLWSPRLDATLAGTPLVARGGGYDRAHPVLRLGIAADGQLGTLRSIFGFSRTLPVSGGGHVETLIEGSVAGLLVRTGVRAAAARYGTVPVAALTGQVDYHGGAVVLDAVRARYGGATMRLGGRVVLGPNVDTTIVVAGAAPARSVPYAENLAPEARVDALALITGGPGYAARGSIGVAGPGVDGQGLFRVNRFGVGDFGPFVFGRRDGSSLIGALRLERDSSRSAAWLSARGYRVDIPKTAARFPGLSVPPFPPVAGTIDADLAGGGSPDRFALSGTLHGRGLRVAGATLGTGDARLAGTLRDVRLGDVALRGPLGGFRGSAAVAGGTFALLGRYRGSLERLVPLTGKQQAFGDVDGPVRATIDDRGIVVQSAGAVLRRTTVRGVAVDAAAGTLAVRHSVLQVIAADGRIGGRRAVAREAAGTIAISAPDLPTTALRGTGLPLDAGNVSVFGIADVRGRAPDFDGTVTVAGGRARGYPVSGDAQIDLDGPRATIFAATGALGATYGSIAGSVDGIGGRALRYDLETRVPLGDIDSLRRDLALPVRYLDGSFGADLHVRGAGTRPTVDGRLDTPEGSLNGLPFRDGSTRLLLNPDGVAARAATVTVGSTRIALDASTGGGRFAVRAVSERADLSDFNDYFDASDTLAGRGRFSLAVRTYGARPVTSGMVDIAGLRYRDYRLGATTAAWSTRGSAIVGRARVASAAGTLAARVSIESAPGGDLATALVHGRDDVDATFERVDLGTWLPAAGFTQPILGRVDGTLAVRGQLPHLALDLDAALADASIAGHPVRVARLHATSDGTRVNVVSGSADLGFATLTANGRLGFAPADPLAFDLRASTGDIGDAIDALLPALHVPEIDGALDADVRIGGTFAKPAIAGGFDLTGARYGTFVVPRAIGEVALNGRVLELRDADLELTRGQAFVAGSLPFAIAPLSLGPPHAPVSFDVTARGVDLSQFAPLLPDGTKLGGTVDGRFGVEGTVDRPRLFGGIAISNGSFSSSFERAPIQHFDARLAFTGSSVALQTFHADVGGGMLDAGGQIRLPLAPGPATSYSLDVRAKRAQLDFPAYGRGTIDGALRLVSGGGQPTLSGNVTLRDAVIPVAAVYGPAGGAAGPAGGRPPIDPRLALHAAAGNNVRIRNGIVDVGVTGAVDVTGSLRAPLLAGTFSATDGTISSYNHVFKLLNATASFSPSDGVLPTIDARATARVSNPDPDPSRNIAGSANIIVTVSGTPDSNNLQVTYSSDPPYSQEQIVGLLLDVPALLGAVNFDLNGGPGAPLLRGAPPETNALLPPGVTPEQISAISFNQEVFSLLNGQFTQRALSPVERVFERLFGLSDLQFTVDYGGGIGYSLRRQIGKRDFYAFVSQTVTYPERSNIGFELQPKPFETVNFSYYQQNGITSLITNSTPGIPYSTGVTHRLTSLQPLGNRSGFSLNFNRRF